MLVFTFYQSYLCTDGQWFHPLVVIVTLTNNAASCTYSWTTLTSRWCNFTSEGRSRRLLIDCSCLNKHPTIVWARSFSSPSFSLERSFAASHILRYIPINDRSDRISGSWKSKSVYKTSMTAGFYIIYGMRVLASSPENDFSVSGIMVLKVRFELTRLYRHQILSLGCLPIPSFKHIML